MVNGTPVISATISGGFDCLELLGALDPIPATIADSSKVVQAFGAAGGASFLAGHPGANLTMGLWGGASLLVLSFPPTWHVAYSLCSLTAKSPQPAPTFDANVSAAA